MVLAGILLVVILAGIMIVIHKSKPEEPKEEITFEEISQAPDSADKRTRPGIYTCMGK